MNIQMGMLLIICIDFLAWPLIALAYPLYASIRAVESGSKYHMTKLVKYWTLFALISLFEFGFAKIILWIPWWPRIRLALLLWLVLPQFDGASYAYQTLHLLEAVVNIKLNGSEALENLIATKECNRDVKFTEAEKNAAAAATIQVKQVNETPDPKQEWNCDLCNVRTTSENNLNAHLKGRIHKSNCASLKAIKLQAKHTGPSYQCKKHDAARPNQIFNRHCHVCDAKLPTENELASHLKGKRHLSNIKNMANLQSLC